VTTRTYLSSGVLEQLDRAQDELNVTSSVPSAGTAVPVASRSLAQAALLPVRRSPGMDGCRGVPPGKQAECCWDRRDG
jgi:hypothetical protein